jgi:hypothetical protein
MKKRWTQELADFLRFCASERRLAPMTCSAYERDVSVCLDYLQGQGIEDLAEVKVTHLRAFLAEEQKRRPAVSSQAGRRRRSSAFSDSSWRRSGCLRDPALPLRTPKKREALPDVLTMGELERLLAQPERHELWESATSPASRNVTGCCSRWWRTAVYAGASCSGSTGTTSTSRGDCCGSGGRKAAGSGRSRSTPRSRRSSLSTRPRASR